MIIKASENERDFLEKHLRDLIKENKSSISIATNEDIIAGIRTLFEDFSINRALLKRAIEKIWEEISARLCEERLQRFAGQNDDEDWYAQQDHEVEVDSIGSELLEPPQ